jgi:hypothetical protein
LFVTDGRPEKSFRVEVHAGWKVAGWPFGKLDIDDEQLTVRSSPLPWIRPRSASREAIGEICLRTMWPVYVLRFAESAGALAGVRVVLALRPNRILRELGSRGYSVIDFGILPK